MQYRLKHHSQAERISRITPFLAPSVHRGMLRVKIGGLVRVYRLSGEPFEGWGVFSPTANGRAQLLHEATVPQILRYLEPLPTARWRLAARWRDRGWLAVPEQPTDATHPLGKLDPMIVQLVTDAARFEVINARFDGATWWAENVDRQSDPANANRLRQAYADRVSEQLLAWKGLTPPMRAAYQLARRPWTSWQSALNGLVASSDVDRLQTAMAEAAGRFLGYQDCGDHWLVRWETRQGQQHSAAIDKTDRTVISAGICLDGLDHDFDLKPLAGVVVHADQG